MARLRDSRSPSPAGSSRRYRRDNDRRRDRERDRDPGDRRRRSRTPPRHDYRRRDRSLNRNDGYHRDRDGRDRRRSRDRYIDNGRDRDRERDKDRRDRDDRRRRDDSRDRTRARREGTADSHRSGPNDAKAKASVEAVDVKPKTASNPSTAQSDVDKKAERLAKLAAWKKKQEDKEKAKEATPGGTRKLLAEMDEKTNGSSAASPTVASPTVAAASAASIASPATAASPAADSSMPSLATPYAGKFDPKQIAKKSARVHESNAAPKLGTIVAELPSSKLAAPISELPKASALPKAKTSGFGFHKQSTDSEKVTQKRKLNLDEEETSERKLAKLPSLPLPDVDDTPYEVQDEDDEEEPDNFAGDEEEEAAAARAAQERREERMAQETHAMDIDEGKQEEPSASTAPETAEVMEVDQEDEEDPLDAFMNDLESKPVPVPKSRVPNQAQQAQPEPEPEAYFSGDDDYDYAKKDDEPGAFLDKVNKARKKKDIPTIDYGKLDLAPLRKNFWVEPSELSEMTEADLTDLRLELDGIKVSGKNVPKPVQKWSQCALSRRTLDIVDSLGFDKPTSIQMQAFPAIMSGRDIIGIAKTGSGKTLAFLLPMFRHIKDQAPLKENDGPIGLIMTPTRELATQIHRDCKPFLKSMGLRAVCAYGGAPIKDHIAELKRGAEIVVCTPGRMIDLLAANQGRVTNLKRVTYVVLDEADRMFDMGFEPQVMKILNNMRPDRQNILFSATMPRIMDSLAKKILKDPVEITVGGKSVVAAEITQIVEVRDEDKKFVRLLELLGELYDKDEDARTLIFVERQERADSLLKELLQKGYPCMSIHGGKDQVDRNQTIADFKAGVVPIMIATSVAARGLDVKQLKLVVNYDAPNHLEDYVHRAGRTGRAGNKGTAVTFVTDEQENSAFCIAKALEQSGQPIPDTVKTLQQAFQEKLKAGKARDSPGFGGKGLDRLDQEREAARLRERKSHRTEGDEEEENEEEKAAEEKKADKALSAIQAAASAVSSRDAAPAVPAPTPQPDLEPKFTIHKREVPAPGTVNNALDKVSSARDAINARLGKSGQLRPGQPIDNKGPDAGAFHATLEINDFPQKARWAVTNRTNVAKILDSTGVSITTKGTFYPAGKEVPPGGEAKLYILVEGDTEVVVSDAMTELTRLLKQGTIAAVDAESRAPMGRYNVV